MDSLFLVVIILTVICLCILIYIAQSKIKPIVFHDRTYANSKIPEFKTDFYTNPYPKTIDIEGQYECTVEDPKPCKVDDFTTLFGCKNLAVTCREFTEDTPYITDSGDKIIIPKTNPGEGIALAMSDVSGACNLHHGDFVLVSTDANSKEYGLICLCKNPGYIGNETVSGACDKVFICNGQIDDINKDLADINCSCGKFQQSTKYEDGTPVCSDILLKDSTSDMQDYVDYIGNTISTDLVDPTYRDNLKIKKILNPCTTSPFGTKINGTIDNSPVKNSGYWCRFDPLASGDLPLQMDILKDSKRTDAFSTALPGKTSKMMLAFAHAGNVDSYGFVGTYPDVPVGEEGKEIIVKVPGAHTPSTIYNTRKSFDPYFTIHNGSCTGAWPTYYCSLKYQSGEMGWDTIPFKPARACPGTFLWGQEDWNLSEKYGTQLEVYKDGDGAEVLPQRVIAARDHYAKWEESLKLGGLLLQKSGVSEFSYKNGTDYAIAKNSGV